MMMMVGSDDVPPPSDTSSARGVPRLHLLLVRVPCVGSEAFMLCNRSRETSGVMMFRCP